MSLNTDIISLELICAVHKTSNIHLTYKQLVHKLQSQVSHFDWVAIYLYDSDREEFILTANAGNMYPLPFNKKTIMQIPMYDSNNNLLGKISVVSKNFTTFDETDYHSLQTLSQELCKKIENER